MTIVFGIIFILGFFVIKRWKHNDARFYQVCWFGSWLVGYLVFLDIRSVGFLILVPLFFLGVFCFSYFRDKCRLMNGLLFNLFLMSFGGYLIFLTFSSESLILYGLLGILGILFILGLLFGAIVLIVFLYWNASVVFRKEGHSLANLLTLLLALFLTFLLIYSQLSANQVFPQWLDALIGMLPTMTFYFALVFYNFLTVSVLYQFNRPKYQQEYIIVLGAGLIDGERVTPLLAKRIDKAIQFYKAQKRATGKGPVLLMSGGQGADEKVPEAVAMRNYAVEQGIPEHAIQLESNSTNTLENMQFSKEIIVQEDADYRAIFVSNNYHIFRAGMFARQAGLKADGIGAKTAFYYLPNAFLREFIAIVVMHKRRHMIVAGLIAFFSIFLAITSLFIG